MAKLSEDDINAVNECLDWTQRARDAGFEQAGVTTDRLAGGLRCTAWLHHGRECRPVMGTTQPTLGAALRSCLEQAPNLDELVATLTARAAETPETADPYRCIA